MRKVRKTEDKKSRRAEVERAGGWEAGKQRKFKPLTFHL
jgi:hypothetical protein